MVSRWLDRDHSDAMEPGVYIVLQERLTADMPNQVHWKVERQRPEGSSVHLDT